MNKTSLGITSLDHPTISALVAADDISGINWMVIIHVKLSLCMSHLGMVILYPEILESNVEFQTLPSF